MTESNNYCHRSSNSHNSPSSSTRSPTLPMSQSGHLSTVVELDVRRSESTAPLTPFSAEKPPGIKSPQELMWLGRFLINSHIAHKRRQESSNSRGMAVEREEMKTEANWKQET